MTNPAEMQRRGAAEHAHGGPIQLQGENHSPERIMFFHGATTGHEKCECPVVDEHGYNVNPGRAPLVPVGHRAHLPVAREKAAQTYDRRRARKAADALATIDVALWDDATRKIIGTLATMCAPSRITTLIDHVQCEADGFSCSPECPAGPSPIIRWAETHIGHTLGQNCTVQCKAAPDRGTEDFREAMATELRRMGFMGPEPTDEPEERCSHGAGTGCVHDNGDYRA